jgi:hypothetical protein
VEDSLAGIYGYTGPDFAVINSTWRATGAAAIEAQRFLRPVVDAIEDGLNKLPIYAGWTTRGVQFDAQTLALYKEGSIIQESAFTSASREWKHFEGNVIMRIFSRDARMIEGISQQPGQKEVLFRTGTYFRVAKVEKEADITIIYMVEV